MGNISNTVNTGNIVNTNNIVYIICDDCLSISEIYPFFNIVNIGNIYYSLSRHISAAVFASSGFIIPLVASLMMCSMSSKVGFPLSIWA